jgi:hypothetical protein
VAGAKAECRLRTHSLVLRSEIEVVRRILGALCVLCGVEGVPKQTEVSSRSSSKSYDVETAAVASDRDHGSNPSPYIPRRSSSIAAGGREMAGLVVARRYLLYREYSDDSERLQVEGREQR